MACLLAISNARSESRFKRVSAIAGWALKSGIASQRRPLRNDNVARSNHLSNSSPGTRISQNYLPLLRLRLTTITCNFDQISRRIRALLRSLDCHIRGSPCCPGRRR